MIRARILVRALLFLPLLIPPAVEASNHTTTDWDVRPSLKFDALCALNVLSGDPYYAEYYQADYDRLAKQLKPEELASFANLKRRIKDQNGGIISAQLTLYFSAVDAETIPEMIRVVDDSSTMKRNLQATPYYDEQQWKVYDESRPDLKAALLALERIRFESDWKQNALPPIEKARATITAELPRYNIVPEIESKLGRALPSNHITVYLLYYSQPHGIKITSTRFLTHYSYPFRIVLRNAIHEMMHPPYDLAHDPELRKDLDSLHSDSFLMDKVEHHDPSFGYNTLDGLVEEDCVQALEEVIAQHFGAGHDSRAYWREQDGGIHVFAVALFSLMQEQHFAEGKEPFPEFLKRMFREGKFAKGEIQRRNEAFLAMKP
jgi:hypothetical protein